MATPEALDSAVRVIWERHGGEVVARLRALEEAAEALRGPGLEHELHERAKQEAHKLAGSLGTFGFHRGSELARQAERLLGADRELGRGDAAELAELTAGMREELGGAQAGPARAGAHADSQPARGLLLVVDDDPQVSARLAVEAEARGFRVLPAGSPEEAREAVAAERPAAVLLDLGFPEGRVGALRLLEELSGAPLAVPVLAFTVSDEFTDRVEVVRRGGRGFLEKSLLPQQVLDVVVRAVDSAQVARAKVLAVDDDPAVVAAVRAILSPRGLEVTTLTEPQGLWKALGEAHPDLVVLDIDMPEVSGIELCRVMRNDPRYSEVPVLFLTASSDPLTLEAVFSAGADDYVMKPVVGPELVMRIENRLERTRLYRELAEKDGVTGLLNRRTSEKALERFLQTAARFGEPMALALLDLDHFKRVNDTLGHAGGDAVLRRVGELLRDAFRGEDVVARWGGDEFVVGTYGMSRDDCVQRIAELLERTREDDPPVSFSAGVAHAPADGVDVRSLYRAADEALYAVKSVGGNQVVPAGWLPSPDDGPLDVLIVEDDESVASLLKAALDTRGYRSEWMGDGRRAAEALAGRNGSGRPRLAVLDVDLPGLSGLGILRQMRDEGTLEDTKVIMLTAHSAEGEVVKALELGAFDHVSKPFSVPVVMQRIRRALNA